MAEQLPAAGMVTGHTVLLAEGDRVSAEVRLNVVQTLSLDTSTLTCPPIQAPATQPTPARS